MRIRNLVLAITMGLGALALPVASQSASAVCHGASAFNVNSQGATEQPLNGVCNNNASYQARFKRGTFNNNVVLKYALSTGATFVSPVSTGNTWVTVGQIIDPGKNAPLYFCIPDAAGNPSICFSGPWTNNGF